MEVWQVIWIHCSLDGKTQLVMGDLEKVDCMGRKYISIVCSVGYGVEVLYPAPIITPFLFLYDYL